MGFLSTWGFWRSVLEITLPIAFVAVGTLITSRAGFLNIGVEGVMLLGAFFGVAGAMWTGSFVLALLVAAAAGALANMLCVFLSYRVGMGTVLAGLAIDIAALGATSTLSQQWFPDGTSTAAGLVPSWFPYAMDAAIVLIAFGFLTFLRRTHTGLIVAAVGERAEVPSTFGISPFRVRMWAACVGGLIVGLGGAMLSLIDVGSFTDNLTAGRGFIALACVILGGWMAFGVLLAALFFGFADAVHFAVAAEGNGVLGQVLVILPYVATLAALALFWGRTKGPAEEGVFLEPSGLRGEEGGGR